MIHTVRPWLLAAVLPLALGLVGGCDGSAGGDDPPAEQDTKTPLPSVPGAPDSPGAPGATDPEAPGSPAPESQKPRSYTRDLRGGFQEEPGLEGEHTYIVHFAAAPLATYRGGVPGLAATNPAAAGTHGKLDAKSPRSLSYKSYLVGAQDQQVQTIARVTGRSVQALRRYTNAINAVTMRLTQDEARRIARMPGVAFVERDRAVMPETDRGPVFIGAPGIWDGTATGVPSQGEGMTVGIIDSGVAIQVELDGVLTHHPSFDAISGDGYVHTNPLGEGVYLGGCVEHPEWCNSKLIGVYSFLQSQPNPGVDPAAPDDDPLWGFKDTSGHGSHVASTAAGNVLFDVPAIDADGNPSTFAFGRISGVAPRASIVSYKVCAPSCFFSDIAAAVEQAIEDGVVDALNQSIGNSGGSPWASTTAQAFLSARAAGIFVAASAGNDGPGPGTAGRGNSAPWVAGVAATSHDRRFPDKLLTDLAGGDTPAPPALTGLAITGGFGGRIVYARDFPVGNPGEPNFDEPEQCLAPFPAGTFAPDMIVVCDRGTIARVDKGRNVRDGGAGALILGNLSGAAPSVDADPHVIPAIHVDAAQADALRAWLSSGGGHTGTITAAEQPVPDLGVADVMASFSSRGPYDAFDILAPSVAAPGLAIFAAGAQVLFDHPGAPSVSGLFGTIQGTSMASPHVAGSALLMKAVHPDWTDAEVLSAFMTTGHTELRKEDGVTPADPFDYGGGRMRIDLAARAGLVLDQPADGFVLADPAVGGDPRALNVAALVDDECISECSWQRTVRATRSASWTVTASPFLEVTPSSFSLAEGELATLSVTATAEGLPADQHAFGAVTLTADDPDVPVQTLQVVVVPGRSNIGRALSLRATRDTESIALEGLRAVPISALTTSVTGLSRAAVEQRALFEDSDTGSPYDDLEDGVTVMLVPFPDFAEQFIIETFDSAAPDLDLFVGLDLNGDGLPSQDEEFCVSATPPATERCVFELGGDLSGFPPFWVLVQSFRASAPGAQDTFRLATTAVGPDGEGGLSTAGPSGPVPGGESFEARVLWNHDMEDGEIFYARVAFHADAEVSDASFLGNVDLRLERGPDDVVVSVPERARADEVMDVAVHVQPNFTAERRTYDIQVALPEGTTYMPGSADASGGSFEDGSVRFRVTRVPTTPALGKVQELGFRVLVNPAAKGETLFMEQANTVDRPDTVPEGSEAFFGVQAFYFSGFLPPIKDGSEVAAGDIVPVRFQLYDVETKAIVFGAQAIAEVRDASGEVVQLGFFQSLGGELVFDFDTTGLAPGAYTITAQLSDGFAYDMGVTVIAP